MAHSPAVRTSGGFFFYMDDYGQLRIEIDEHMEILDAADIDAILALCGWRRMDAAAAVRPEFSVTYTVPCEPDAVTGNAVNIAVAPTEG